MNKSTIIVLVVIAVLIVGVLIYTSSQQAKKDRELQLQLAQMQSGGGGTEGGWLNSLTDLIGIGSSLKDLFQKKTNGIDGNSIDGMLVEDFPTMNSDSSPYIDTEEASRRGCEFMTVIVDDMEFNA